MINDTYVHFSVAETSVVQFFVIFAKRFIKSKVQLSVIILKTNLRKRKSYENIMYNNENPFSNQYICQFMKWIKSSFIYFYTHICSFKPLLGFKYIYICNAKENSIVIL